MDLGQIPIFSLLTNRMTWLSSRQSVLAENVANSATPNYVARDLRPEDFSQVLANQTNASSLSATNPRHISVHANPPGIVEENAFGEGGTPTGNVVSLEQEMIKLSETQLQYQTASNLYQKAVDMFRTALGGGRLP